MTTNEDGSKSPCKSILEMIDDDTRSKLSSYSTGCGGQEKAHAVVTCAVNPRFSLDTSLFPKLLQFDRDTYFTYAAAFSFGTIIEQVPLPSLYCHGVR